MVEMQVEDWLDDLCVRFIVNLPREESQDVERICFQVEEAQWFYEDFIRPLDPHLPSLTLRQFSLRIFQHCPLFRQWDANHYTQAFADFLAYKQRVPVRGAIMLNHAMDKVVLVKGWKKGANWSFPRGKINKDEHDLDCAVREVYEETGFDIAAAGLVKEEKDMKSIDITMREQHMKLYVFKGVPEDTHFEPRTRKEISKIDWYKLTDLPTIKKHKQQDGNLPDHTVPGANKFYMVAPFLGPLKKWINQQKKKNHRHSSNLAAPPILAQDTDLDVVSDNPVIPLQQPQTPSDLPEVTLAKPLSPTSQLKQLFNLGPSLQPQLDTQSVPPSHLPQADALKSSALLSLLKGPAAVELRGGPNTPLEQVSFPVDVPSLPHHSQVRQPLTSAQHLPPFNMQSELPTSPQRTNVSARPFPPKQYQYPSSQALPFENANFPDHAMRNFSTAAAAPSMAPYQHTGDPEFARPQQPDPRIPPASSLPKLTTHTKSLLDMFTAKSPSSQGPGLQKPTIGNQTLLDLFMSPIANNAQPLPPGPAATYLDQQRRLDRTRVVSPIDSTATATAAAFQRPQSTRKDDLLALFGQKPSIYSAPPQPAEPARVELAANPAQEPKQGDVLLNLLRKQKSHKAMKQQHPLSTSKEGKTSASMNGPLDQPNFDIIAKVQKVDPNGMGRSPLTTHRTLFDPKQPAPVKIMARPETPRQGAGKSPKPSKARMAAASPKRNAKPSQKEPAKAFHPQILKRPQTSEGPPTSDGAGKVVKVPATHAVAVGGNTLAMSREVSSEKDKSLASGKASEADSHRQTLLSLFGGPSPGSVKAGIVPLRDVSPLSMCQITSPKDEVPLSALEGPISTRPRMGSLVSVGSVGPTPRPGLEKRQTGAQDKAFLLGMLGKIASQQG